MNFARIAVLLAPLAAFGGIEKADVVVIGGTSSGVEAALAAKASGADVVLLESRPALGSDIAGKLLIEAPGGKLTTPLAVRRELDERLIGAKVPYRTWVYAKDILRDASGNVAGVTVVSRSGERTVSAKCVVDATERAYAARRAGSEFLPFPAGEYRVRRRVVSGQKPESPGVVARPVGGTGVHKVGRPVLDASVAEIKGILWDCEMTITMKDGSPSSYAAMEQAARDRTWTRLQLESAETCIFDAPDKLVRDARGVFTCGPLGGVSPGEAGRCAAEFAASSHPGEPVPGTARPPETLGMRRLAVVGLGTGGAPALVCGARANLNPVGFEYTYRFGGITTEGVIGGYWFGNPVGFTAEMDRALPGAGVVYSQAKENWFRSSAVSRGAMVYLGALVYGLEKSGSRICALKVMLVDGAPARVPVEAVVDATGNCDVAAAAGEDTEFITADELSLQGAAFMRKKLGSSDLNLDWAFVNDCDAEDLWYNSLRGRNSYERDGRFWDQSQVVNSRERRRLVGMFRVTPQDVMLKRTYPDIVCITRSNFDTHGQTVDPQFFVKSTEKEPLSVNLPYRAILPKKTDNLAVVGLGLSASRDAMPILRMQPDVQNQGWVAAKACEHAIREGKALRDIDVKALQRDLISKGIVPEWVLTAKDSLPVSDDRIAAAVASIPDGYSGLPEVFSSPERSVPLLEKAYALATNESARVAYAHVLGLLGSPFGAASLVKKLTGVSWDDGWNFRGMGQFGRSVSTLDSYIIALARSRAGMARDVVASLAAKLDSSSRYSHFRAIALYFEAIGDVRDAGMLADLLDKPGIAGHAFSMGRDGVPPIPEYDVYNFKSRRPECHGAASVPDGERSVCLRELVIARALYRLGDRDGRGKAVLEAYANDPRRAYAEHARLVLAQSAAPDDSGMFPFVIRPDVAGTAADMSSLLEVPAGKGGFLRREGEHIVDASGRRVRLNGVNLTARGNFPSHEEADRLSAQFARLGFNCVRLHYFDTTEYKNCFQPPQPCLLKEDSEGRLAVDEEMRDRFEYLIAALKRRGIYINMNIHAARQLKPADGVPKTPWANRGVDFFNPKLIAEEKEFAREILRHVNPYTGLALADDPAMAILEVNNENALMQVWWSKTLERQNADPCYTAEFHRLREAAGYNDTTNGVNKFIIETEKRYFRTMIDFMRVELGVKCPFVGTQQDYTAAWVMSETCDVIDTHIYWNHPNWKVPPGTDGHTGRTLGVEWWFRNCAIVDSDVTDYNGNPIVYRGSRRVKGLPFITSEAASPYPCWYGAEFQPMVHAYGAFQDWAGIFVYSWNNAIEAFPDYNEYFFSHSARPDCVAHFPACAALFLRGDVAEAKRRVVVPADRDLLVELAGQKGFRRSLAAADVSSCSRERYSNAVFLKHGVSVDLSPAPGDRAPAFDTPPAYARHVSDTGELALEPTTCSNGVFTVDTPNVKVLTGHTDGRRFDLGGVVFEPGCTKLGWSAVSLVSRDGNGIRPGSRLLLAATGYTRNGGAVFHKKEGLMWGGITEELGEGKTVTEGVPLTITLPCAAAKCWALDEAGARRGEVPVGACGGKSTVRVGPAFRTVWYEIELAL